MAADSYFRRNMKDKQKNRIIAAPAITKFFFFKVLFFEPSIMGLDIRVKYFLRSCS